MIGSHLLKRYVEHDPRSRAFPADGITPKRSVWWHSYGLPLDQGDIGSCTADAFCQWRNALPAHTHKMAMLRQSDAYDLYHWETMLQGGPIFPPADPGGSGLSVCKAAVAGGFISSYRHAFGIFHAAEAIQVGPFLVGSNWYDSMFEPIAVALVAPAMVEIAPDAVVKGGHEYLCTGYSPRLSLWRFLNSWGREWGASGHFYMTSETFHRLLEEQGDITVPVL